MWWWGAGVEVPCAVFGPRSRHENMVCATSGGARQAQCWQLQQHTLLLRHRPGCPVPRPQLCAQNPATCNSGIVMFKLFGEIHVR